MSVSCRTICIPSPPSLPAESRTPYVSPSSLREPALPCTDRVVGLTTGPVVCDAQSAAAATIRYEKRRSWLSL